MTKDEIIFYSVIGVAALLSGIAIEYGIFGYLSLPIILIAALLLTRLIKKSSQ